MSRKPKLMEPIGKGFADIFEKAVSKPLRKRQADLRKKKSKKKKEK